MLIFRYLAKDVFLTLLALTIFMLLVFLGDAFLSALKHVANGRIPLGFITHLMIFEVPNLLWKALPLAFYLALLIVYGRLYADSEITVLQACGYGSGQLLKHSLLMASLVAMVVMIITLWLGPIILTKETELMKSSDVRMLIKTTAPERFRAVQDGYLVVYTESINIAHTMAGRTFVARRDDKTDNPQWSILWVDNAYAKMDKESSNDFIVLDNGILYQGIPGKADYRVHEFEHYQSRLPPIEKGNIRNDIRMIETVNLLPFYHSDRIKTAELNWRLSMPLLVFTLTLIAVPFSRTNPGSGSYSRLLPAILIFIIYVHLLCCIHTSIVWEHTTPKMNIWGLHSIFVTFGLFLQYKPKILKLLKQWKQRMLRLRSQEK